MVKLSLGLTIAMLLVPALVLALAGGAAAPSPSAPAPAADQAPTLQALLDGVVARDAQTQRELKKMEFDDHIVTDRLDTSGKVTQHQDLRVIVRPGAAKQFEVVSMHGDNLPTNPDAAAKQAQGKKAQQFQQAFDLKKIMARFNFTLLGTSNELGPKAYIIGFEPKPNQPYKDLTEKVIDQLHGRFWVRASDDLVLRTQATLLQPVPVAWVFASVTRLDFDYELPPGGSDYGPAWLKTYVEVHAPLIHFDQKQRMDMDHFRPRQS
jgi:hypothetical protein